MFLSGCIFINTLNSLLEYVWVLEINYLYCDMILAYASSYPNSQSQLGPFLIGMNPVLETK